MDVHHVVIPSPGKTEVVFIARQCEEAEECGVVWWMTSLQLLRDAHGDFCGKLQSVSLALLTWLCVLIAAFPLCIFVPERSVWSQNLFYKEVPLPLLGTAFIMTSGMLQVETTQSLL